jgi:hypothetical protein
VSTPTHPAELISKNKKKQKNKIADAAASCRRPPTPVESKPNLN